MGRIHDALERAERERARQGGATAGSAAPQSSPQDATAGTRRARKLERRNEIRSARRGRVMIGDVESSVTDEYRTLRGRIQSIRLERAIRSIVVTSAVPGEGKSTTALNLAMSFGLERDKKTCLVDADLRAPSLHRALPAPPDAGLSELLASDAKLGEALVQLPDMGLWVLPVRALPSHPSELLASDRMRLLMEELADRFDTVLLDSPPVLGLPDAAGLIDLCDAALLVVNSGTTRRSDVETCLERIDAEKVLGTVMNRCPDVVRPYSDGGGS